MKKMLVLLLLLVPADLLFGEPYIAVREGLKCSACHENHTGGGKRTAMGAMIGTQTLPWHKVDLKKEKIPEYWSFLNDRISVGGDFRFANTSTFTKDNPANTFETQKSNVYLNFNLLPDTLSAYVDESVAPGGAQTREFFALFTAMPANGWIKAGKLIQPYGLRLEDDEAFIRQQTGFTFATPDIGAEIGLEPGNWSMQLAVTNGSSGSLDTNLNKQVVGSLAYVAHPFRVGVSGSWNKGDAGSKNSGALFAGFRLGPAVLLGEADLIHDSTSPPSRDQFVAYSEMDVLVHRGWNVKIGYEYFDPNTSVAEDQRNRVILGLETFIVPFLQVQAFYRFNQGIPQNPAQNADELMVRVHAYF